MTILHAHMQFSWPFTLVTILTQGNTDYLLKIYAQTPEWIGEQVSKKIDYNFSDLKSAKDAAVLFKTNPKEFAKNYGFIDGVKLDYVYPVDVGLEYYPGITNEIEKGIETKYIYSVGLDIYKYLNDESSQLNRTDQDVFKILGMYLYNVPIKFAYFQQFKTILKKLEEIYLNWENRDYFKGVTSRAEIAFAIGVAYGTLEAQPHSKWDKRYSTNPKYEKYSADFVARILSSYFGEDLKTMPSIKTFKYLMRRGRRTYKLMMRSGNTDYKYFKMGFLLSLDYSTVKQSRKIFSEKGLEHIEIDQLPNQWIAADLLYGIENGVEVNRDSRGIDVPSPKKRQNGKTLEIEGLDSENLKRYSFNNVDIAVAIYNTCKNNDLGFPWNAKTIAIALLGNNSSMKKEVQSILLEKMDEVFELDPKLIASLLESADSNFINLLIKKLENGQMSRNMGNGLAQWAQSRYLDDFNKRDQLLVMAILKYAYDYLPSYVYPYAPPAGFSNYNFGLARFVLPYRFAIMTSMQPIADWDLIWKKVGVYNLAIYLLGGMKSWQSFLDLSADLAKFGDIRDIEIPINIFLDREWQNISASFTVNTNEDYEMVEARLLDHNNAWVRYLGFSLLTKSNMNWSSLFEKMSTKKFFFEYIEYIFNFSDKKISANLIENFGSEQADYLWRKEKSQLINLFLGSTKFQIAFWNNLQKINERTKSRFSSMSGFVEQVITQLSIKQLKALNQSQADFLADYLESLSKYSASMDLMETLVSSPHPRLHQFAVDTIKTMKKMDHYWLLIAETNLPYCLSASKAYLLSNQKRDNFSDLLLMALDSNQIKTRALGLDVIREMSYQFDISTIVDNLSEHYDPDIWRVVVNNFEDLSSEELKNDFLVKLLLSRRKARSLKEQVKNQLISADPILDVETLIRMARGSNLNDRDFAFQMLAKHHVASKEVKISQTNIGDKDVY